MFWNPFQKRITRQEHEAILTIYKDALGEAQADVYRLRDENSSLVGELAALREREEKRQASLRAWNARYKGNANLIPGAKKGEGV